MSRNAEQARPGKVSKVSTTYIVCVRWIVSWDVGTILYVKGPTNRNKCCGKNGGGMGDQYIGGPLDFKVE